MKLFLLSLFTLSAHLGFSEIRTIHTFQEASLDLENATKDSLVLFDVDEVLITSKDRALTPSGKNYISPTMRKLPKEQADELISVMLAGTNYTLIEPTVLQTIQELFDRGIPTMGFTACWTGQLGVIPSMENWRFKQLTALGIDLSRSFSHHLSFPHLVSSDEHAPLFKNGILFCGDLYQPGKSTKGILLGHFLDHLNLKPTEVLFFDDDLKNLIAVEEVLSQRNIPFKGFHFVQDWPETDAALATLQLETALTQKKWLTDEQAKELLK